MQSEKTYRHSRNSRQSRFTVVFGCCDIDKMVYERKTNNKTNQQQQQILSICRQIVTHWTMHETPRNMGVYVYRWLELWEKSARNGKKSHTECVRHTRLDKRTMQKSIDDQIIGVRRQRQQNRNQTVCGKKLRRNFLCHVYLHVCVCEAPSN